MKPYILIALALTHVTTQAQTLSLDDALRAAIKNRPAIESARLNLERAKLSARALGSPAPTTLGIGYSSREEIGATDDDLFLSQPIDLFGRSAAGRRVGQAEIKAAEADYRTTLAQLQSEVLTAYFEALSAQNHAEVATEVLHIAEGLKSATERKFEEGKIPEVQRIRATIEFDRAKQSAALRQSQLSAAKKRLAGLLRIDEVQLALDSKSDLASVQNQPLDQRPDLLLLQAEKEAAQAEIGIANVSTRPELELQARRSSWHDSTAYYGARIQLTWSFFDHGRAKFERKAAEKKRDATEAKYKDARQLAESELKAIESEIAAAQSRVESYAEILAAARSLVAKSQRGYDEGVGTLIDVLEATRALRETEQELAEAKFDLAKAVIAQYQASGYLLEVVR